MKKIFFALCVLIAGCNTTTIMNSWKAPGETLTPQEYKKIMVVAYVKDEQGRKTVEDEIAKFNKNIHPSYPEFTGAQIAQDTARLKAMIKEKGYDAVIIMKLITTKAKSTYVQGGTNPAYDNYIFYYNDYYKAGSFATDMEFIISTNIYSLTKDKLIWSGVTSSTNPKKLEKLVNGVAKAVAYQMKEDKLIPAK
jgi:hypothetical protein